MQAALRECMRDEGAYAAFRTRRLVEMEAAAIAREEARERARQAEGGGAGAAGAAAAAGALGGAAVAGR